MGVSLGLLGGGGSILTVPVLVYVLGYAPKTAIVMSVLIVGTTSLVGAFSHWRAGNVNLRTAVLFGVVSMAGAFVGAKLSVLFTGKAQLMILAVVMLAAAISMLRSQPPTPGETDAPHARVPMVLLALIGLCVGVLTGIVGVGGGFLIVPTLVLLAHVPVKEAVGTSLSVIVMNSASSYLGYYGTVDVPWLFLSGFAGVAVVGILGGTALVSRVSSRALKRGFAVFLVVMGVFVLYQNRTVLGL
jgi:uncharacterized membrane protein YfcA